AWRRISAASATRSSGRRRSSSAARYWSLWRLRSSLSRLRSRSRTAGSEQVGVDAELALERRPAVRFVLRPGTFELGYQSLEASPVLVWHERDHLVPRL